MTKLRFHSIAAAVAVAVAALATTSSSSAAQPATTVAQPDVRPDELRSRPPINKTSPPQIGGRMFFQDVLYNHAPQFGKPTGARVGTAEIVCTLVSTSHLECIVTAHLPGGELAAHGIEPDPLASLDLRRHRRIRHLRERPRRDHRHRPEQHKDARHRNARSLEGWGAGWPSPGHPARGTPSEHQPNTLRYPWAPRRPPESLGFAPIQGPEGLEGTGCHHRSTLVMKGSTRLERCSAGSNRAANVRNHPRATVWNELAEHPKSSMNKAIARHSSPLAVLVASACHAGGRGFESRRSRFRRACTAGSFWLIRPYSWRGRGALGANSPDRCSCGRTNCASRSRACSPASTSSEPVDSVRPPASEVESCLGLRLMR